MCKIVCFGSLNFDLVYKVPHFVAPGETLASLSFERHFGGKGFNQSIAMARAGASVKLVGAVGKDGSPLLDYAKASGINVEDVQIKNSATGHAIIQVHNSGQNAILLAPGANGEVDLEHVKKVLKTLSKGDCVVLQNEINDVDSMIAMAKENGAVVVFNPSPYHESINHYPLQKVDWLIVNEIEAHGITQKKTLEEVLLAFEDGYKNTGVVVTLGEKGVICLRKGKRYHHEAQKVNAIDTTGAGDTFLGYFVQAITKDDDILGALAMATKAAGVAVTRRGASAAVPYYYEIE